MKKVLLATIASSFFMFSCTEDLENTILPSESGKFQTRALMSDADFQIVNYNGEDCIQFRNDSVFHVVVDSFCKMSDEEVKAILSGYNFTSQKQIMEEAITEQELIVDNYEKDPNQPFPHQEIENFKQKYNDVFIFDPYDSTNFIPHYKLENPSQCIFTNRSGIFLIGDSIVHSPVFNSIEEYFGSGITFYADEEASNEKTDVNTAYSQIKPADSNRKKRLVKVKIRIYFGGEEFVKDGNYTYKYQRIMFDQLSEKKKILWKKHHATIHVRFNMSGSGNKGVEVHYTDHLGYQIAGMPFLHSAEIYGEKEGFYWGRVGEHKPVTIFDQSPKYSLTGRMEIWSNEIPESKKGTAKIDLTIQQ